MNIKCILGFHDWGGSKCSKCGKTREQNQDKPQTITSTSGSKREEKREPSKVKTETFVDKRDNRSYKCVRLGGQVWMAENLAFIPHVSPEEKPGGIWVYGYNGASVDEAITTDMFKTYGCLYDHKTAKAACPAGWRLPSMADYEKLTDHFGGGRSSMYFKLRDDDVGFNAVLGGVRHTDTYKKTFRGGWEEVRKVDGAFSSIEKVGEFWTATAAFGDHDFHLLYIDRSLMEAYVSNLGVSSAVSVRCIKA